MKALDPHQRETAAVMAAGQALQLANFHRCVPGAAARCLVDTWGSYDHALLDAEHLLRRGLEDFAPDSIEAFQLVNALAAIVDAMGVSNGR